ncbi:helicase RepA family protein, partial [Lactococcus petauri]|uniref:helicase RepA family protein n=1 Tax=Lactococcus petauri TaxID=1940789 RepID=UPI0021F20F90
MVVTAPPENYKTWVALEAAVQVALGKQSNGFLGGAWMGPDVPEAVLIVQQEDDEKKLWQRIETIIRSKG